MKLFAFIALLLFSLSSTSQDCIIGHFPLNGNGSNVIASSASGTLNGPVPASDRFGNAGQALYFDGVDDEIEIPTPNYYLDTFSYSVWVKPMTMPGIRGYQSIFSTGSGGGNDQALVLGNDPAFQQVGYGFGSWGGGSHSSYVDTLPDLNLWHHIAVVRADSFIRLYVNGIPADTVIIASSSAAYGSNPVSFIGSRLGFGQYFHGDIDDLKIFGCILNFQEISALYNQSAPISNSISEKQTPSFVYNQKLKHLYLSNGEAIGSISVSNILGQEVYRCEVETNRLQLNLNGGLYLFRGSAQGVEYSGRLYITP